MEFLRQLRDSLLLKFVYAVLAPFACILGVLLRSYYRKVNGQHTPGLTAYRPHQY